MEGKNTDIFRNILGINDNEQAGLFQTYICSRNSYSIILIQDSCHSHASVIGHASHASAV